MNTSLSKFLRLIPLIALTALVTACGTPFERATEIAQTMPIEGPATSVEPMVQVIPSEGAVEGRVIFTEEVSQNNCGNSRDGYIPQKLDSKYCETLTSSGT